jgi:GNAT superfamily N-acetyltransferase
MSEAEDRKREDEGTVIRELVLRPACSGDEPFLFRLFCSVREPDFAFLEGPEKEMLLEMQFAARQQHFHMQMPKAEHKIVMLDGRPIGAFAALLSGGGLHLAEIALLPEHRDRGIGSILMKVLESLSWTEGAQPLPFRLHVYKQSPAVRFYQKLGFLAVEDDGVNLLMEKLPDLK